MKGYERASLYTLPRRMPVIIRVDGKAFHTFTKDMNRPFDDTFIEAMMLTALDLCKNIPTSVLAYSQSDEISILLHNYKKLNSQPWFGNEVQKITSISASIAASYFSKFYNRAAYFDSRTFVLPEADVNNYFLWRQKDASRNSIQMLAQSLYSHKELHLKNIKVQQEMIFQKSQNWNDLPTYKKRGFCIRKVEEKWKTDIEIPLFNQDTTYIGDLLLVDEQ